MIDSHAHLTDERFTGEVESVLARAVEAGVEAVVTIGTDLEDSRAAVALSERFARLFATVGIHPHAAEGASPEALHALRQLAEHPRVVAIGETGLDFHYDFAPREAQLQSFHAQLELAAELDLPVVVHSRESDQELTAVLRERGAGVRGVLHCFAGGRDLLETALAVGWYVSFAGLITFKKFDAAELLRAVPADRLLVETDSPYLAPVPFRGKRNEPAHVAAVARRAAELRDESLADLVAGTDRNARAFYRLPAP
jgi:TatD DNase family protein